MAFFKGILDCLTGTEERFSATASYNTNNETNEDEKRHASEILHILFTAEEPDKNMKEQLNNIVHANNWHESLAKRILNSLVQALKSGAAMGSAMKEAYDKASEAANEFVEKHPVFAAAILTVVAIGILVVMVPWIVEALGFGELGPIAGT